MERMTWECFLKDIKIIHDISQQLNDNWQIVTNNEDVSGTYLVKTKTLSLSTEDDLEESVPSTLIEDFEEDWRLAEETPSEVSQLNHSRKEELIKFEYHVLYHLSYAVPFLCFNANKSNGSLLTLDEAWNIFNDMEPKQNAIQKNMLNILTQMEHPVLFKPFLTLHPCRIAEVLQSLPHSQNKVLSFLSIYGPTVYLTFDLEYANHFDDKSNLQIENNDQNKL